MEFQHEKEAREKAAEKHRVESDKQVELGKILKLIRIVLVVPSAVSLD